MSWQTYKTVFGDFFENNGAEVYAVIRHPLDILSSWWRYRQRPQILNENHPRFDRRTSEIAFGNWVKLWASKGDSPSTVFATQKQTLQNSKGNPASIRLFHLASLQVLEAELTDRIGKTVSFGRLNISPEISHEIDHDFLLRLPRYREELNFFESLSAMVVA